MAGTNIFGCLPAFAWWFDQKMTSIFGFYIPGLTYSEVCVKM